MTHSGELKHIKANPAVLASEHPKLWGVSITPGNGGVTGDYYGDGDPDIDHSSGFLGGIDPQFRQQAGVYGESNHQGVLGHATTDTGTGVFGNSKGGGFGVRGESVDGTAVQGHSFGNGVGVAGISKHHHGVTGINQGSDGTPGGDGVHGQTYTPGRYGVSGFNRTNEGAGVYGYGGKYAGWFAGTVKAQDVEVDNEIRAYDVVVTGGDCAENFDVSELDQIDPGTVVVIDSEGVLKPSTERFDKRVVGVISGAGNYKPGILLDQQEDSSKKRMPLALTGKVYCKADAQYGPIEVGDFLTTSQTPGHAMKVRQDYSAAGATIGKALSSLSSGQGLVLMLVALQ